MPNKPALTGLCVNIPYAKLPNIKSKKTKDPNKLLFDKTSKEYSAKKMKKMNIFFKSF